MKDLQMLACSRYCKTFKSHLMFSAAVCSFVGNFFGHMTAAAADAATLTLIKHVIIIIGENRSFYHVFATYVPVNKNDRSPVSLG